MTGVVRTKKVNYSAKQQRACVMNELGAMTI
jgi:hypothetical protein